MKPFLGRIPESLSSLSQSSISRVFVSHEFLGFFHGRVDARPSLVGLNELFSQDFGHYRKVVFGDCT